MPAPAVHRSLTRSVRLATLGLALSPLLVLAAEEAIELEAQSVVAPPQAERANGPVAGYVASRSATGTKTDTPLLETPQSVSVLTADRIRDLGSLTVQDALRYTAGMRGETYGLDSRGDWSMIRGSAPSIFLDGLQQTFGSYTNTRTDPFTLVGTVGYSF
jgi:iron complex outermembrane receptor protein